MIGGTTMIKYHQNGIEPEYRADHQLTNNWNPDAEYDNEYVTVYFRINAVAYQYPFNNFNEHEKNAFYNDVKLALAPLGWTMENNSEEWNCDYIVKGKQKLYLHPQDFSGEVLKNNVREIAEAIQKHTTFSLRWVDLYETVYDISDGEYEEYLINKNDQIREILFEICKTNRTSQFYYIFDVCCSAADKVKLNRVGLNDGKNYGSGQTIEHILSVAKEMARAGYLVLARNDEYVRSINKTEQKKMKLKIA